MDNPFIAGLYGDIQTYHVDVGDRLLVVRSFNLSQCEAALALNGLQKTVEKAVRARIRKLAPRQRLTTRQ